MNLPAPACKKALADATARWANRNRASDGIMGDQAHQARPSDHNAGNAFDLTHDPEHGVNCNELSLRVTKDARVKYVIWKGRIFKTRVGYWEVYRGANPHNSHMHVSIHAYARDDLRAWPWSSSQGYEVLRASNEGQAVRVLQSKLGIEVDGRFGPKTLAAVRRFQQSKGLKVDGIVDREVWEALG